MTIHNGEAAIYFKEKGFHRLVLSREMSFEEIKHISTDLMIETEMICSWCYMCKLFWSMLNELYYWRKKWQ